MPNLRKIRPLRPSALLALGGLLLAGGGCRQAKLPEAPPPAEETLEFALEDNQDAASVPAASGSPQLAWVLAPCHLYVTPPATLPSLAAGAAAIDRLGHQPAVMRGDEVQILALKAPWAEVQIRSRKAPELFTQADLDAPKNMFASNARGWLPTFLLYPKAGVQWVALSADASLFTAPDYLTRWPKQLPYGPLALLRGQQAPFALVQLLLGGQNAPKVAWAWILAPQLSSQGEALAAAQLLQVAFDLRAVDLGTSELLLSDAKQRYGQTALLESYFPPQATPLWAPADGEQSSQPWEPEPSDAQEAAPAASSDADADADAPATAQPLSEP